MLIPLQTMTRERRLSDLILVLADANDVTVDDLRSSKRRGQLPQVRAQIGFAAHEESDYSYPEIGRALDKHHTTILLAVRRYRAQRATEAAGE